MNELMVFPKDGQVLTTSLVIAEKFGKQHKNVIKSIRELQCSDDFNRLNFEPVNYLDSKGEARLMYNITRDGCMFLVMGFTGALAAAVKEQFIRAFNEMEAYIKGGLTAIKPGELIAMRRYRTSLIEKLKKASDPDIRQDAMQNLTWVSEKLSLPVPDMESIVHNPEHTHLFVILERVVIDLKTGAYPFAWTLKSVKAPKPERTSKDCLVIKPAEVVHHIRETPLLKDFRKQNLIKSTFTLKKILKTKGLIWKENFHPYINNVRILHCIAIPLDRLLEYGLVITGSEAQRHPEASSVHLETESSSV